MAKKYLKKLEGVIQFLGPMDISVHSAYTSFFVILSMFPMLVILFGILAYTSLGLSEVMSFLDGFLPAAFLPLAEKIMTGAYENTSGTMVSLSALTALWSAGRGIRGLLNGLNSVYDLKENRSYLATRGISMLYAFAFVVMLILTLVLYVFGETIADYLRMTTNPVLIFLMDIINWRFILMLLLQILIFAAMYAYLPNRRHGLLESFPGAIFASLGWAVCANLFSLYVENYPNYANVFGSFYAAALAMLWLYLSVTIIFLGGAINRWVLERKNENPSP